MKKVQIMLATIGIFSLTGAVLAFKVGITGTTSYCFTTDISTTICPLGLLNASIGPGNVIRYRVTTNPAACNELPGGILCASQGGQINL